jgi:hypothetical protein
LAKALPPNTIEALLAALGEDADTGRRDDWVIRDRAIVLAKLSKGATIGLCLQTSTTLNG